MNSRLVPSICVGDIMTKDHPTVTVHTTLTQFKEEVDRHHSRGFPVLDDDGRLFGMITMTDFEKARDRGIDLSTSIKNICTTDIITALPDETLMEVLPRIFDFQLGRVPVVDPEDERILLGMLRDRDIYAAWRMAFHHGEKSILQ